MTNHSIGLILMPVRNLYTKPTPLTKLLWRKEGVGLTQLRRTGHVKHSLGGDDHTNISPVKRVPGLLPSPLWQHVHEPKDQRSALTLLLE